MDLYFDFGFFFNVLIPFSKKYILVDRPPWGTRTVTLAFSFLEDAIKSPPSSSLKWKLYWDPVGFKRKT